jgi:UDPglucose 6-dehydrogenase
MDRRIGSLFLKAGLGYGGSCFPKDVKALISLSNQHKVNVPLLDVVHSVNEEQPIEAIKMAQEALGNLKGRIIAILGLAFKPDTDDMREAVSVRIINKLLGEQATIKVHDPLAIPTARRIFGDSIEYCSTREDCIRGSDCVIIATEWKEYSTLTPRTFSSLMREPLIIDGRRVLSPHAFSKLRYYAIGLGH